MPSHPYWFKSHCFFPLSIVKFIAIQQSIECVFPFKSKCKKTVSCGVMGREMMVSSVCGITWFTGEYVCDSVKQSLPLKVLEPKTKMALWPLIISYGNGCVLTDHSAWMPFIQLRPYWWYAQAGLIFCLHFSILLCPAGWQHRTAQGCRFWLWCEGSAVSLRHAKQTKSMQLAMVRGCCRIH